MDKDKVFSIDFSYYELCLLLRSLQIAEGAFAIVNYSYVVDEMFKKLVEKVEGIFHDADED